MVVTGGGRGIGAATAKLAAARGYAVCVNYLHNREAAENVVRQNTAGNGEAVALQADISSEAEVVSLFRQIDSRLGRISCLVNNAATLGRQMRLDSIEASRIARVLGVNVTGSMICAREAVKRMSTRHGGSGGAIVTSRPGLQNMDRRENTSSRGRRHSRQCSPLGVCLHRIVCQRG